MDGKIILRIDERHKAELVKFAQRRGLTVSSLMRMATLDYVARNPLPEFSNEATLAKRLAAREAVNDESII